MASGNKQFQDRSWKNIDQSSHSRAITAIAKKRKFTHFFKFYGLVLLIITTLGALFWDRFVPAGHPNAKINAQPIQQIVFKTNGVLTSSWLQKRIKLKKGMTLMDVDLFSLSDELKKFSQIKDAIVEREFPNKLHIRLVEHEPLLSVAIKGSDGKLQRLLITEDGHVYSAYGYSKAKLQQLPFLGGLDLKKTENGYEPIKGMEPIVEFMQTSKKMKPALFNQFMSLSSDYMSSGLLKENSIIHVRMKNKLEVIFPIKDYGSQLDRLDYILNYLYKYQLPNVKRIDLALGEEAAVQFSDKIGNKHKK